MPRQPRFENITQSVVENGKGLASVSREVASLLRKNAEVVKFLQASTQVEAEKKVLEDYLQDPALNPLLERKFIEEDTVPKILSEKDRLIQKILRQLNSSEAFEIDWYYRLLKTSKKGPSQPAAAPEKVSRKATVA